MQSELYAQPVAELSLSRCSNGGDSNNPSMSHHGTINRHHQSERVPAILAPRLQTQYSIESSIQSPHIITRVENKPSLDPLGTIPSTPDSRSCLSSSHTSYMNTAFPTFAKQPLPDFDYQYPSMPSSRSTERQGFSAVPCNEELEGQGSHIWR